MFSGVRSAMLDRVCVFRACEQRLTSQDRKGPYWAKPLQKVVHGLLGLNMGVQNMNKFETPPRSETF